MKTFKEILQERVKNGVEYGCPKHPQSEWNTPKWDEVSLGKDKKGFFCYTHRCRSGSYEDPRKIPIKNVEFVASTG